MFLGHDTGAKRIWVAWALPLRGGPGAFSARGGHTERNASANFESVAPREQTKTYSSKHVILREQQLTNHVKKSHRESLP